MKAKLALIGFISITQSLLAGWVVETSGEATGRIKFVPTSDQSQLKHSTEIGVESVSFDEALKKLSDAGLIQKLSITSAWTLLSEDSFQDEIFAVLERKAPDRLKEALKSSGNMHNPKVEALYGDFVKALLSTPTITKLNASLAPYHFKVSDAVSDLDIEEFTLEKVPKDSKRRFHGALRLTIAKSS